MVRRRQMVAELAQIFPIGPATMPTGGSSSRLLVICGAALPDSEEFAGRDENVIAVSLWYVAQLLKQVSALLHVPLCYPVAAAGSCSSICDHIIEHLGDGQRDFPLFARGQERSHFEYAVYLLNKDLAQLRYYCGLPTHQLASTLPNARASGR